MKRRTLIAMCCVAVIVAILIAAISFFADGHNSDAGPAPTPSFDEQVDALSEKLDALGWKSYGHFGEFDLSTDSPTNAWGRDEEAQGYIDAITEAIIYGE